jgi:hypothetical protein
MPKLVKNRPGGKTPARNEAIDTREQLFNGREIGPIGQVQLPVDLITAVHGILYDIDPPLYRPDAPSVTAGTSREKFFEATLAPWLGRHPALAGAEVRDSGRGLHAIVRFDAPVRLETGGDRERWAGVIQVVQAALPVDPDQPGITALTRPVGSINSKTGRPVTLLEPGRLVPVDDVLRLYGQMDRAPFRTVTGIVFGTDRITPCPVCGAAGSSLTALDYAGRCYGSCGTVKLERLYDVFLAPRAPNGKGAADATR